MREFVKDVAAAYFAYQAIKWLVVGLTAAPSMGASIVAGMATP